MIHLEDIRYTYGTSLALDGVSVHVDRGDAVALIGPNGSGKSTLMKIMVALLSSDSGRYTYDGTVVDAQAIADRKLSKDLHRRIGFLFQDSSSQLFCPTVADELAFGPIELGLGEAATENRVADCAALLGIEPLLQRAPYELSEGEKRKVALAAVLSLNPETLILDEPLNALDPKMKRFLCDLLRSLKAAGKTILASTHDFEYLGRLFNKAIVLGADHRILRAGPYRDIIEDREFLAAHNIV